MPTPIKILIIQSEENQTFLKAENVKKHLEIAFGNLLVHNNEIDIANISDVDKTAVEKSSNIILIYHNNFDIKPFLNKLKPGDINKCILLLEDEDIAIIASLNQLPQYLFFDIDPETGLSRKYIDSDSSTSVMYWSVILDIAYDLSTSKENQPVVYVAQTTPDLYQYRNAICSELAHRGFNVFPKHLLNGNGEEITSLANKYMENAKMSVHLVGSHYGKQLKELDISITELQCRIAAKKWRLSTQQEGSTFQRLIWLPPFLKAADDRQERFLQTLRIEDKNDASEVLQVPLEDLKATIREKINEWTNATNGSAQNQKSVYLIHEFKQAEKTKPIAEFLNSQGIKVIQISPKAQADKIITQHLEYLATSGVALIIDNGSSSTWVKNKMKDLVKAPGYGRQKPFIAKALFTMQADKYKTLATNQEAIIIDGSLSYEKAFSDFLKKLNSAQ